jgi:hypothetical protein
MRRFPLLLVGLLLAASAVAARAAESYAILAHTQRIQGDVPAGYPVRLEFPLPAGSEPRITLTLTGGTPLKPVSLGTARLYGPDGNEITLPQGEFFNTTFSKGNPTLTFRGWTATESGNHQLVVTTNARITAHAKGRLLVVRPTKVVYNGDETTTTPMQVSLEPRDITSVVVTRLSGTAPKVGSYRLPSGFSSTPGQKMTKQGSTSNGLFAVDFGVYEYTIGYQAVPAAGRWKAVLRIKPFKGGTPATLRVRNSPGVPISVLTVDRSLVPTFAAGGTGVGVATDGNFTVLVTSEVGGVLTGQAYDLDLAPSLQFPPNAIPLTNASDFTAGETLSGHRLMFMAGSYFAAFSTTSGNELSILRLRTDFLRTGYSQVVTSSPDPTTDFFLTGNGTKVSVGIFHAPDSHNVTVLDAADFGIRTNVAIGGGAYPQKNGAGAVWRANDSVFELWTPDSLDYHLPSDLHRVLYDANWSPTTPDAKLVSDVPDMETMPTAVVVDAGRTDATIVHYVVADNPPLPGAAPGTGRIHRRLFDAAGDEIPDSHVILPRASCNRPTSTLLGNFLYLGFETPSGPMVERYQILR